MKKVFLMACGAVVLALLMPLPYAKAQSLAVVSSGLMHKPLMIIRFNQPRVFYKKSLFTALSKAIEVEPSVMFNLVSYVPRTGDAASDERALAKANAHLREVVGQMRKMGVPQTQISINNELQAGLRYDEIHIFVR